MNEIFPVFVFTFVERWLNLGWTFTYQLLPDNCSITYYLVIGSTNLVGSLVFIGVTRLLMLTIEFNSNLFLIPVSQSTPLSAVFTVYGEFSNPLSVIWWILWEFKQEFKLAKAYFEPRWCSLTRTESRMFIVSDKVSHELNTSKVNIDVSYLGKGRVNCCERYNDRFVYYESV